MRNQIDLINNFMPIYEKEWESQLFIDKAIKDKAEYHLESIARALSGIYQLEISRSENKPFKVTEHIRSDDGEFIEKTERYEWAVKFDAYTLYGKNKLQIWLKIIDFWAGNCMIKPCGGASLPNKNIERKKEANEVQ